MFKVFGVKKRHEIILAERDIMMVLRILDEVSQETRRGVLLMDMEIGRCDPDETNDWFIWFHISDKNWSSVINKLDEKGRYLILTDELSFYLK